MHQEPRIQRPHFQVPRWLESLESPPRHVPTLPVKPNCRPIRNVSKRPPPLIRRRCASGCHLEGTNA
ncbi:hypothetical protein B0T21DRAFT_102500 [Apiosordaria backusii]|uniref:Uncharacterized protein n=1 Tax=Apiosordaria backusii TaxID=314023 RepID=A0AA40ETU9_9PEZI|nr:hypothetical protein B0T21DRAFT_102500 [Apiosordaria backusii]